MNLPTEEIELFYELYSKLLKFVVKVKKPKGYQTLLSKINVPMELEAAANARDLLLAEKGLISDFISSKHSQLNKEEISILESWLNWKHSHFAVVKILKNHVIFIDLEGSNAYGVLFLYSDPLEVLDFTPRIIEALILPWKNRIIYDGLIIKKEINIDSKRKKLLNSIYLGEKKKGIITSLVPDQTKPQEIYREKSKDSNVIPIH